MEILSHVAAAHELECVQQADLGGIETEFEDIEEMHNDLIISLRAQHSNPNPSFLNPNPFPGRHP
jgi:hypothetical protein